MLNKTPYYFLGKAFVDGHYLIASAALATFWQTYYLCPIKIKPTSDLWVLSGLIFFMTLGIYNLHSLIGIRLLHKVPKDFSPRFELAEKFPLIFYFNASFSAVASIFLLLFSSENTLFQLIPAFILGVLYIIPILGKYRLRDFPFVKLFVVALVWAWATVYLPFVNDLKDYKNLSPFFIERLLFIFAITLPFDIRDLELDKIEKVKTLSASLGATYTISLSMTLLIAWAVLAFNLYEKNWTLFLGGFGIAFLVFRLNYIKIKDSYFGIILDGSILLLAMMALFFVFCA